jgi:hypothetical protein
MVTSLTPKVTSVVSDQLPSYLADTAPNLVSFIEYYYDWLESNGSPLEFVRNIIEQHDYDNADEIYKTLLDKGVLNNLPTSINVDKSILVKNVKDVYRLKGTEDSFQFLLNAIFGEKSELLWGKDQYFKTSDSINTRDNVICIRQPQIEAESRIFQGKVVDVRLTQNDIGFYTEPKVSFIRSDDTIDGVPVIDYELSGYITKATVENGGYGFTTATVTVHGDNTTPAQILVNIVDGAIVSFNVVNAGAGYKELPTLTITGDGFNATGYLEWSAIVGSVSIIDPGLGWSTPPELVLIGGNGTKEVTVIDDDGQEVIQVVKSETAKISFTIDNNGSLATATITSPGENYIFKPSHKWILTPNRDAIAEAIISGNRVSGVKIKNLGTNYKIPPVVIFEVDQYDYSKLEGNRITQEGDDYATAIVDNVVSYAHGGETFYVLTLQPEGLKGTFKSGSIIRDSNGLLAITTPIFSAANIINAGSGYKKGAYVDFIGDGLGGRLLINDVSTGSVDECIITKSGSGYQAGEEIVGGGTTQGSNFLAEIATVDGIDAKAEVVMEIDELKIIDNGYDYQAGDELFIYGGSDYENDADFTLAKVRVLTTISSNDLKQINVDSGGAGYQYTSFAILPDVNSTSPLRQIRPNLASYVNGSIEAAPGIITTVINSGIIKSVDWSLTDPDLNDSSISLIVNGTGATMSVATVDGSGRVTDLTIGAVGINYVNPVVNITSTGTGASIVLTLNEFGSLISQSTVSAATWSANLVTVTTSANHSLSSNDRVTIAGMTPAGYNGVYTITKVNATQFTYVKIVNPGVTTVLGTVNAWVIISSGSGYQVTDPVAITEKCGKGAVLFPVLKQGGVSSLDFKDRGEFKIVDKTATVPYRIFGGSGQELVVDLYYRPKKIDVVNQGKYYSSYDLAFSDGHGAGAVIDLEVRDDVIHSFNISNAGSGYTWARVHVKSITGAMFEGKVTLNAGAIQSIVITNGGYGYDALDQVIIYGDGANAVVSIHTIRDGVIKSALIRSHGSHYHYGCNLTISSTLTPSVSAVLGPVIENGVVKSVQVINGGAGYSLDSTADITYVEASTDPDPEHVYFGVGDRGGNTYIYGSTGTTIVDTSPIWPLSGAGHINSMFQVVDFVDIWPQVSAFPKAANYKIDTAPFGVISKINLLSGGSGYFDEWERAPLSLRVVGDGNGASLEPVLKDGGIIDVIILDGGEDYTSATITIEGGQFSGTSAVLVPSIVNGVIVNVGIVTAGTGYYYGTQVSIVGDGSGAKARVTVNTGVTNVEILNAGTNYSNLSVSLVVTDNNPPNTVPGSGAILKCVVEDGKIIDVLIINPGKGYYNPLVNVTHGSGQNGVIVAFARRPIESIFLEEGGRNYINADVRIVGDGYGADAEVEISQNSLSTVEVLYQGNRYTRTPQVTINDNSGYGAISSVKIKDMGRGYHELPVLTINSQSGMGGEIVSFSQSIGQVKGIRFDEFSFGSTSLPMIQFPISAIVPENTSYLDNEYVYVKGYNYPDGDIMAGPHARVRSLDFDRNLVSFDSATDEYVFITDDSEIEIELESENLINQNNLLVHEYSFGINLGDILVGSQSKSEGRLLKMNRGNGYSVMTGLGRYPLSIQSSQGNLSNSRYKLSNNQRYQDFAYIIKSGLMYSDYAAYVDKIVHLAGYSSWGDVGIQTNILNKVKLPVDAITGKSLFDIITLFFSLPTAYSTKLYYDYWRLENCLISSLQIDTKSLIEVEAMLSAGFYSNVTWPTETCKEYIVGTGTYDVTDNLTTVTKAGHGLVVGDKVSLSFLTGGAVSGFYVVASVIGDVFTVVTSSHKYIANYAASGSTTITVSLSVHSDYDDLTGDAILASHGFKVNDTIDVAKILPVVDDIIQGTLVDQSYTISAIDYVAGTFEFESAAPVTTGGDSYISVLPTLTSGNVSIEKHIERMYSTTVIRPWKENVFYEMNDIVETSHNDIYYAKTGHTSTDDNKPSGVSSNWFPHSRLIHENYPL